MNADTRLHADAASAAAALCGDPAMAERVRAHAAAVRLVTMLTDMRLARGFTQTELARRMGVSPGKVSRLEASADVALRLADVQRWARALDLRVSIEFSVPAIQAP